MRIILASIVVVAAFSVVFSQSDKKRKKVKWQDWSDSLAFFSGPEPLVRGEGVYSDSLSVAYDGKTFFEVDGEYFAINSVADYYLWFVTKYPFLFNSPISAYRHSYIDGDNYQMAYFIGYHYRGKKIPLKFVFVGGGYKHSLGTNRPMADERASMHTQTNMQSEVAKAYKSPAMVAPTPKTPTPKKRN